MTNAPQNAVVWIEIPVSDMSRSRAFYEKVLVCKMVAQDGGPNPILVFPVSDEKNGIAGHLYPGQPSPGAVPTVHLAIPDDLETAMDRTEAAGGTVMRRVIEFPAGKFVYATDLDGNSIGLFQEST